MRATQNGLYPTVFGRVKLQLNPHAPMTLQYPAVTDLPTHQRLARYRKGNRTTGWKKSIISSDDT